ncbi:MBL fold metallo-hydrolase [Brachybacterium sacelli]|uniref:L-ascorbate metabolism protein UlaG (Beta-lactamase superfamily) n=1 Tax=Brachybacterium sacelli TaxID=173364 RepID=A0ABS4X442_9MICO|nr:MBL fold metallo-hydrolase [Brachybacterium sacelli]MBP2383232.1 L-ascorbate metabolism protein UlaG (beta-lactamase superfamily) [Brachybacterium sacelli]
MKIRHLVHSCLLVETAGRRLLVDPGGFSAQAVRALTPEVLGTLDAVAVTHQHPDHLDRALLAEVLAASAEAIVIAEPETAQQLAEPSEGAPAVDGERLLPLSAGTAHEFPATGEHPPLRISAVGGNHAIIHPDIPRVGNTGLVLTAGDGPRLGITGDSLEPVPEFHGIDVLAFAVVAPWSKMSETIDFLRSVRPVLALPVHDAVASDVGRPIFLRQSTHLAPEGTEVRDWPAGGVVEITAS